MIHLLVALVLLLAMPVHSMDSELKVYYDDYMSIVEQHCTKDQLHLPRRTSVEFVDSMDKGVAATCSGTRNSWTIRVSRQAWDRALLNQQFEVIFHEFSHCILLLDHVDKRGDYMYNSTGDIPINVIKDQVLRDAWARCK